MYCTKCGIAMDEKCVYCSQCGAATANAPAAVTGPPKRLMRSIYDKKIAGVCAGVANYLDVDVTAVRLIWLILTFTPPGVGLIAYIVAWIVMPKESARLEAAHPQAAGTALYQS
jgi:phage shock protein C